MKRKLLAMIVCCVMLAGCGKNGDAAQSSSQPEGRDTLDVMESLSDEAGDGVTDGEDEMYSEDGTDREPEEGTYELTLYNGEVVTIRESSYLLVTLGNTEQLLATDTLDILLDDVQTIHFPAESLSAAIDNYDAVSASAGYRAEESYSSEANLKSLSLSFADVENYVWVVLDNESEAEDADVSALPVTKIHISVDYGSATIQGFRFKRRSFSFDELLTAWGEPIGVVINCRLEQDSNGEDQPVYYYEYFWRFNDGYIALDLAGNIDDESLSVEGIEMVQWDTLAFEASDSWGIPKYGEE